MTVSESLLESLKAVVGPKGWIDAPDDVAPYLVEQRGLYRGSCAAVVRPASTAETAEVVRLCAAAGVGIVPQGGNTGLVGGGVPEDGIVLATGRMNRIRAIDPANHTMTVEAGCILSAIQAAAAEAGCLFPLSLASEGSCQIGGNISTNAGGTGVLRYGNTRDLVLGLEVVLPDGRVWDGLRGLRKDNTGYDLKQLFVGAEGSLGIITAAVIKLFPMPRCKETAMAALNDVQAVQTLFGRAWEAGGDTLSAFEMTGRTGLEFVLRHFAGTKDPFDTPHPFYALIELTSTRTDENLRDTLEEVLAAAFEDGTVVDAVIAQSETQAYDLWQLRENISDAQKFEGGSIKHDVSVPVSRVAEFVERATVLVERELPGIRPCPFGHMGDGNIHFNLSQPVGMDTPAFIDQWGHFNRIVHDLVVSMDGSFSAEHGIGQLKRDELSRYKPDVEMDLMRRIKKAFDPDNILNPGKVV